MSAAAADALDIRVDLRTSWKAIREQGDRQSCLACATSDAHAHCHGREEPLSAEFLFFHAGQLMPAKDVSQGLTFEVVDEALRVQGQPDEAEWPYSMTQPKPWTAPAVTVRWHGGLSEPDTAIATIINTVEAQRPVVLGLRLTPEFLSLAVRPYIVPTTGRGYGGHAVLAVGLADHPLHGSLILVRNSWGTQWGDGGCGWISAAYLHYNLIGYRVVDPLAHP